MARQVRRSRLVRKEGDKLKRQTVVTLLLTVFAIFALIYWGIPALIRMAIFLGELRNSSQPIDQQDTLAPSRPQLESLPTATKDNTITISGFAEAESLVQLYRSGSKLKETFTSSEGDFSFSGVLLKDGDNTFYVTATDTAGNESEQSNRETIIYDATPPKLVIDSPQDGAEIFGPSNQTTTITGSTDPDTDIDVNGRFALVGSEGNFSVSYFLENGDNKLVITAIDAAGNQTVKEITVKYSQ